MKAWLDTLAAVVMSPIGQLVLAELLLWLKSPRPATTSQLPQNSDAVVLAEGLRLAIQKVLNADPQAAEFGPPLPHHDHKKAR